jgi:fibronectin-binding autotransporter adhesin
MKPLLGRIAAFGMATFVAYACLNTAFTASAQVTTTSDNGPGSLRYVAANAAPGATIIFQSSLSGQTIVLTNGEIILSNSVTIDASALASGIQINGDNTDRVFTVNSGATVVLNSLTITNGFAMGTNNLENSFSAVGGDGDGGGIYNNGILTLDSCILTGNKVQGGFAPDGTAGRSQGGGIYNNGTLTLNSCALTGNIVDGNIGGGDLGDCYGGAICNNGTVMINNCNLSNNSINAGDTDYAYGGAIYDNGTLTITNSTVANNSAGAIEDDAQGGAISIQAGTVTVNNSTLANNIAECSVGATGGAIDNGGTLTMDNCTLSGNSATGDGYNGGGINNGGTLRMNNCTLVNNSVSAGFGTPNGGGIYNGGTLNLTNSIVCSNTPAPNISGSYTGANNLVDTSALLALLGNYGGPTQTMPPLVGSPAIDAGIDSVTNLYTTDQRGYPRLSGSHVDIGAVEVQASTDTVTTTNDNGPGSLRYIAANAFPKSTIIFQSSLSGQTIVLTNGEIILSNSVAIDASALASGIQINGDSTDRVFTVNSGATVVLNSLTITNGNLVPPINTINNATGTNGLGGGIYNNGILTLNNCTLIGNTVWGGTAPGGMAGNGEGGGIYNNDMLTLNSCVLAGNVIQGGMGAEMGEAYGGGIYNNGTLIVNNSILTSNHFNSSWIDYGYGGAIYDNGTLTITNSTLASNAASAYEDVAFGGAIYINAGTATVNSSTLAYNNAESDVGATGGGIANGGTLTMDNCTLAGNSATGEGYNGGGINNSGTLRLNNCTLVNNSISTGFGSPSGGGIYNSGTLNLTNSIVCSNTPSPNIYGSYTGANNLVDANPLLEALGNYGGPTQTMPPLPGSPAIDAGVDSVTNLYTTDQRGYPRLSGSHVDIGAVEVQVAKSPFMLPGGKGAVQFANGQAQINFTNLDGGSFTVFATTNVALPFSTWSNLGTAVETPTGSGHFQFSDPQAAGVRRFYRVRSP